MVNHCELIDQVVIDDGYWWSLGSVTRIVDVEWSGRLVKQKFTVADYGECCGEFRESRATKTWVCPWVSMGLLVSPTCLTLELETIILKWHACCGRHREDLSLMVADSAYAIILKVALIDEIVSITNKYCMGLIMIMLRWWRQLAITMDAAYHQTTRCWMGCSEHKSSICGCVCCVLVWWVWWFWEWGSSLVVNCQ